MNPIIYNVRVLGYRCTRWTTDALKRPFYAWEFSPTDWLIVKIAKGIIMALGLLLSLPFRKVANWLNPYDYCHVKGNAQASDCESEINVLSLNMLGFHANQAKDENRPFWTKRFDEICKVIEDSDADVVCLQEVHCGSWLENKLIERFKSTYSDFYGDIAPKALMFGSGLFVMHRLKGVRLDVHKYKAKAGSDAQFVSKAFATLVGNDFTVTNTHMQSGNARKDETMRKVRWQQTEELIKTVRGHGKKVNISCGDKNEDRTDSASYMTSWLNPKNGQVIDGFKSDNERMTYTQADLKKDHSIDTQEAVDNIVAIRSKYMGETNCNLSTKHVSTFVLYHSPTDHAALLGRVKFSTKAPKVGH